MIVLNFKNYKDKVAAAVLKKAAKLIVRDFDESEKNHFVAYVDDGAISFDVSIKITSEDEIIESNCDCENGTRSCAHKIAFISFILNKKAIITKIVRKKKLSNTEEIIYATNEIDLKNWVVDLFKTNKDLELLFKAQFDKTSITFDKKSIKIIIDTAIKSIIKNKKNIDASEITKIVKLLEVSLQPVINYFKTTISSPETYDLLDFIYNEIIDFNNRIYSTSVKLIRLYEKIYKEVILYIQAIQNIEQWKKVMLHYFTFLTELNPTTIHFDNLVYFYESIALSDRKKIFANVLSLIYNSDDFKGKYNSVEFNEFILKVLSENQLFESVYTSFRAFRYANRYNILLINKLLEINKINEAIKIAEEQIKGNSNEYYNDDYYEILEPLYIATNNKSGLIIIDIQLIRKDFSFERYLNIKTNWKKSEKEFIILRTSLLAFCKRNFYEHIEAKLLYFTILNSYNNYRLMFENINENIGYEVIFKFKEVLFQVNSLDFLTSLNNLPFEIKHLTKEEQERNNDYRQQLLTWILNHYDEAILKRISVLKNRYKTTFFEALNQYFNTN